MIDHEQDLIARGEHARRIVNDELYVEAWEKVRQAILAKFEASPVRDTEGREHLFKMLKALNDAKGALEQVMRDGKVAVHLREEKRRFKIFG
jgi:hypothetical protein